MYRLTRISLSYPKATLSLLALVTIALAAGLPRLRTEFGYRVLLGDSHPSIRALDAFIEQFGGGLPVQITWKCGSGHPCKTVFDQESLEMADAVTRGLSSYPNIARVRSPANAPLLVPSEDGFSIRRFVENGEVVSDVEDLAVRARDDSFWVGTLISSDATVGIIVVQPSDTTSETDLQVVDAIETTLVPFEERGFRFYLLGDAAENVIGGRDLAESSARLIPFTVLVILLVLFALCRSWKSVGLVMAVMATALLWTFGTLGWLDWPRDGILEVLAPLILVVGVCDAIHLLSRFILELDLGGRPESRDAASSALLSAARDVGSACLITTLTTAGAFLSFATSALETFVRFGCIAAFGVIVCLILTFTLLPAVLGPLPLLPKCSTDRSKIWNTALEALARTTQRRALPILVTTTLVFAVCGIGWLFYLSVDTNWLESWGERSRVVKAIRFLEDHVGRSATLEVRVELPTTTTVNDPSTLEALCEFSAYLSGVDGLGPTKSVVDLIERLNRFLHGDDPSFERVADSGPANAQILELIAFDGGDVLGSWLSLDRSTLRISVDVPEQSYAETRKILRAIRDYVHSHLARNWMVHLSGEFAITYDWIRDVQRTQVRSFPTAFILVFVMVAIFLRSARLAIAAMVPTLLPVVVTLGAMGWMGMSLDVGRAMIAAVMIGIGVDDSIHLLDQYRRRRGRGEGPVDAMKGSVLHVGRAVVTTSIALSLGFLTLMASAWQTISSFGFFVSVAILGALAAALFVLPALIFAFARED